MVIVGMNWRVMLQRHKIELVISSSQIRALKLKLLKEKCKTRCEVWGRSNINQGWRRSRAREGWRRSSACEGWRTLAQDDGFDHDVDDPTHSPPKLAEVSFVGCSKLVINDTSYREKSRATIRTPQKRMLQILRTTILRFVQQRCICE